MRLLFTVVVSALVAAAGPGTWAPSGDCTPVRYEHAAGLLSDGRVLVTGGSSNPSGNNLTSAKLFQAPATWTDTGAMNNPRTCHSQTLLSDGRVLVAGGRILTGPPEGPQLYVYLNSAEVYSPTTGAWTTVASMSSPRAFQTATLLANGNVLVTGGLSPFFLSSAEIYNPAANSWTTVAPMFLTRYGHAAVRLQDGRVLVAGSVLTSSIPEIYDPSTNTWTYTATGTGLGGFNNLAFRIPDGRILAFDGTPFLYSPDTGVWVQGAPMPVGTNPVSGSLLQDGRLIVTGGQNGSVQADVRVFDPVTNTWTLDASMGSARYAHSTVTLPDGRVLVVGGFAGSGLNPATELYTPTPSDTTAPVITSIKATPGSIWPPNGKWVAVSLSVTATDAGDPAPSSKIVSITSNEAPQGGAADWAITGDLTASLRAKNNQRGATRIYTLVVRCTDASGNHSDRPVTVKVRP